MTDGIGTAQVLMVMFTLYQDPACWWVVALMPSLMILFGLCRGDAMSKVRNVSEWFVSTHFLDDLW